MTSVALIDYDHPRDGFANRDQTGTFGSYMHANGFVGKVLTRLKKGHLVIPNLTLAYLNGIGRKNGLDMSFYTGMPTGEDYVIIASSMVQWRNEVELAKQIKERYPHSKVGFINAFATTQPEFFEEAADFIIQGEVEPVFEEFCRGETELKGRVRNKKTADFAALGHPDWRGFPVEKYSYFPGLLRKPFITMQASRGCSFGCTFCPYMVLQERPFRTRPISDVIAEISHLKEAYGIKAIQFRDITFTLDMQRIKDLCKEIIKQRFDIDFGCETRLDRLDNELIDLMAAAQFKVCNVGVESPEGDLLAKNGRIPIKEQRMDSTISYLEASGINVQAFYIIGLEHETEESIMNTIRYSQQLNTFSAQYCVFTPFPGTKTFEQLKGKLLTSDFAKFTEYDPVVRLEHITGERITELKNLAYSSYYRRPKWLKKHGFKLGLDFAKSTLN